MNINWDAKGYTDDFAFVHKYGEDVLELITAPKGSFVVDLGCGNGALTKKLSDIGYNVLGIDASDDMLCVARQSYPQLKFIQADAVSFNLEQKADCIFSNAVFHWIDNQQGLIDNLYNQLKPNGELVFEFGGKGCAQAVHDTLAEIFKENGLEYTRAFYFPSISEYSTLLEKSGFEVRFACLFDRPTPQKGENGVVDWINMFNKAPFENVDSSLASKIKKEAQERLKDRLCTDNVWYIDYVRIRMRAIKLS